VAHWEPGWPDVHRGRVSVNMSTVDVRSAEGLFDTRYLQKAGSPQGGVLVPICARGDAYTSGPSNGTIVTGLMTLKYTPEISGQGLYMDFWNFGSSGSSALGWGESIATLSTMTLQCGAFASTTFVRATVNGMQQATMDPGGKLLFYIPGFDVRAGTVINVQYGWSVPTSGVFPRWNARLYSSAIDSIDNTKGPSNVGTATATGGSGTTYGPSAVLTVPTAKSYCVGIFGDSIGAGLHDDATTFNQIGYSGPGHLARGLTAAGIPQRQISLPSESMTYQVFPGLCKRMECLTGVTHVILQLGTNDFGLTLTVAQVQALAIAEATRLTNLGIRVGWATLTPRADQSASPTAWAQTNAQVAGNQVVSTYAGLISTYNAWLRTIPAPGTFLVDAQVLLQESAASPNTWGNGGQVLSGTVTSGSTTTAVSTSLTGTSGAYEDMTIQWTLLHGAAPITADGWRYITGHSGGSGTATFAATSVAAQVGDTFNLWKGWTVDGLHPNTWGSIQAQTAISAGLFTS